MGLSRALLLFCTCIALHSCDPTFNISVVNKSDSDIEVIASDPFDPHGRAEKVFYKSDSMYRYTIGPEKKISVGFIAASYTAKPIDVFVKRLVVVSGTDTVTFNSPQEISDAYNEEMELTDGVYIR